MHKIMIIDDEENILKSLRRTLSKNPDWDIEHYLNPIGALKRAKDSIFDVVICDFRMPEMDGNEFFCELIKIQPETIRIMLAGPVEIGPFLKAIKKAGIFRYIEKPWDDGKLMEAINDGIRHRLSVFEICATKNTLPK